MPSRTRAFARYDERARDDERERARARESHPGDARGRYKLWALADADLLENPNAYQLWNTGQGLNRVQGCPLVAREMQRILAKVQRESGAWVGLSVVHLGDRDVPNALVRSALFFARVSADRAP